jgi:hypothetical protein
MFDSLATNLYMLGLLMYGDHPLGHFGVARAHLICHTAAIEAFIYLVVGWPGLVKYSYR